ncbi:zinc-ribbon domain-containing protein [bacterium]|nr:zinc-ribbon domain-containing protein [bacterium]
MPKKTFLKDTAPDLFSELVEDLNPGIDLEDLVSTSSAVVTWQCKQGHRWTTRVRNRSCDGSACPYCSRKRASPDYNLAVKAPGIAAEWNWHRNAGAKPEDFLPSSMKKVWWQCDKGHEWHASINGRNAGNGCPYCSNRKIGYGNDLSSLYPELATEWHPTKNGKLKPSDIAPGSSKRQWWRCSKGHEWRAIVGERVKGTSCPKCRLERNFEAEYPNLAKEWSTKNDCRPNTVFCGSNKMFLFLCPKGHEYLSSPAKRISGRGCSYCAGKLVDPSHNLASEYSELMAEWDYHKNALKPSEYTTKSAQSVWWKCKKGHSWKAKIGNRTGRGSGCPYCAPTNSKAAADNNLVITHPDLMEEWDWDKNTTLDPKKLKSGSTAKPHWRCAFGHEWTAAIYSRASGRGCPKCRSSISRAEIRILSELEAVFPEVMHHTKVENVECDLLVGNVAIEIDGKYWHQGREKNDAEKNTFLAERGVSVIRLRDYSIGRISAHDIGYDESDLRPWVICKLILKICTICKKPLPVWLDEYANAEAFREEERFKELSSRFPLPLEGKSLADTHPEISVLWDREANGGLTPRHITPGSNVNAHWICEEGHRFERRVGVMTRGSSDCPHCKQRFTHGTTPLREQSFGGKYPDLVVSWHERNEADPFTLPPKSNKVYWFRCDKGHEWETSLDRRTKYGCPYCAGQRLAKGKSLAAIAPFVAAEWALDLNNGVKPDDVSVGTKKLKPWWRCSNCGREWQAMSYDRVKKRTGCPFCKHRPPEEFSK